MARSFSIGRSAEGAELWVLELGLSPGNQAPKPHFKYLVRAKPARRPGPDYVACHQKGVARCKRFGSG